MRTHKKRTRRLVLALAALPIAIGSVAVTAPTASALNGYVSANLPATQFDSYARSAANHSYGKHIEDLRECKTYLKRDCTFAEWTGMIADALRNPVDSFAATVNVRATGQTLPAGRQIYFYQPPGSIGSTGIIVIANQHHPSSSTAYFSDQRSFAKLAAQSGIRSDAPPPHCASALNNARQNTTTATPKANPAGTKNHTSTKVKGAAHAASTWLKVPTNAKGDSGMPLAGVTPRLNNGYIYAVGADGNLKRSNSSTPSWTTDSGSSADCNTAEITTDITRPVDFDTRIFARTLDGQVRWRNPTDANWTNLGGGIVTTPVVETHSVPDGNIRRLEEWVWGVGTDGNLWSRSADPSANWIKFPVLPGGRKVMTAPALETYPGDLNKLSAWVVDDHGDLEQLSSSNAGTSWAWDNRGNAGTPLASTPSVVLNPYGSEWVSAVDQSGKLQGRWYNMHGGSGWAQWGNNGSPLLNTDAPGTRAWASAQQEGIESYVTSEDGNVDNLYAIDRTSTSLWYSRSKPSGAKIVTQTYITDIKMAADYSPWTWGVDENGNLETTNGHVPWINFGHP
ncbi:hypothetical protein [Streptomyces kronopolitis]